MHDFIVAEDSKLWGIIYDGPFIPTKTVSNPVVVVTVPETRKEFNGADRKTIEKNFVQRKFLFVALLLMNIIGYQHANQLRNSRKLSKQLIKEQRRMKDGESIQNMHTRFTFIINELHSLGEIIPRNKLVRKILSVLPSSSESKMNAITEAKDLQELTINH
ncbi:uncharacterized protein [Nicotiana sylvestris]|uniref:uncharacterized protein n=1 Tax=Nicotiana sylvestris TaxID=4096 RepID=UPI00388CDEF9